MNSASLFNFEEYFLTAAARFGELISSSKSIITLILYFNSISFLLIISRALNIIITGPLASDDDLAKILRSFSKISFIEIPFNISQLTISYFSFIFSFNTALYGSCCSHFELSTG